MNKSSFGAGVFYSVLAYVLWGFLPLYWRLLAAVNPLHIVAFRILFSLVLVSCILFIRKNFKWANLLKNKRDGASLLIAGVLLSLNWILYIWAVNNGYTIEAALGYYISPIISVVLGLIFFKEKINLLQKLAFLLAVIAVAILVVFTGSPPWISLGLAFSFGIYGLLKKNTKFSALESLGRETLAASPISLILLTGTFAIGGEFSDIQGLGYLLELPHLTLFLLMLCGFVTMFPLYLFAKGLKLLPLSTVGFLQFLTPTLTFLVGVFIFRESFPPHNFIVFGLIWAAVILYVVSLKTNNGFDRY